MQSRQIQTVRLLSSSFLASLVFFIGVVFYFTMLTRNFHGFVPDIPKETILTLRTVMAAASIFFFFPLIWILNRRSDTKNASQWMVLMIVALAFAEGPGIFGLVLFLIKGAFKTFFAFLALSSFYMFIIWPRNT